MNEFNNVALKIKRLRIEDNEIKNNNTLARPHVGTLQFNTIEWYTKLFIGLHFNNNQDLPNNSYYGSQTLRSRFCQQHNDNDEIK